MFYKCIVNQSDYFPLFSFPFCLLTVVVCVCVCVCVRVCIDLLSSLFLVVLGLHCCSQAFSSCKKQGLLFTVASVVAEHRLQSSSSVIVVHRLSCFTACGIFPDQGSNWYPLRCKADHLTTREALLTIVNHKRT